jgi:hypothetical protein
VPTFGNRPIAAFEPFALPMVLPSASTAVHCFFLPRPVCDMVPRTSPLDLSTMFHLPRIPAFAATTERPVTSAGGAAFLSLLALGVSAVGSGVTSAGAAGAGAGAAGAGAGVTSALGA